MEGDAKPCSSQGSPAPRWLPPWQPNKLDTGARPDFQPAARPPEDVANPPAANAEHNEIEPTASAPSRPQSTLDIAHYSHDVLQKEPGSLGPSMRPFQSLNDGHEGAGPEGARIPREVTRGVNMERGTMGAWQDRTTGASYIRDRACVDRYAGNNRHEGAESPPPAQTGKAVGVLRDLSDRERVVSQGGCSRHEGAESPPQGQSEKTAGVLRDLLDRERAVSRAARQRVRELEADGHEVQFFSAYTCGL